MDYKEKYNEALERAKVLYQKADENDSLTEMSKYEQIFPELRESEDEKIRKHIVEILKDLPGCYWYGQKEKDDSLAWLEKQKNLFKCGPGLYLYDGEHTECCGFPVTEEKQKEPRDYRKFYGEIANSEWFKQNYVGKSLGEEQPTNSEIPKELKPEWSEEDEKMLKDIDLALRKLYDASTRLRIETWLESLRPKSKDEIYKEKVEAFKLGKHSLAARFENYLDENRPEGKMFLSIEECDDIDKAFEENNWEKIMRYANKYAWKPSEEQMKALLNAEGFLRAGLQHDSAKTIADLYEQLKEL